MCCRAAQQVRKTDDTYTRLRGGNATCIVLVSIHCLTAVCVLDVRQPNTPAIDTRYCFVTSLTVIFDISFIFGFIFVHIVFVLHSLLKCTKTNQHPV